MRKLIAATLMGAMIGFNPIQGPSAAAVGYDCVNRRDDFQTTFTVTTIYVSGKTIVTKGELYYIYCKGKGLPTYSKVDFSLNIYNVEGTRLDCGQSTRWFEGVRFNWRFWRPKTSVEFNPGPIVVDCREDSTHAEIQDYDFSEQPQLRYGNNNPPRWACKIVPRIVLWNDPERTVSDRFRP